MLAALLADITRPLVAISGEPGVGKTRRLEEALPNAWWLACREGQEQVPFAPIAELLEDQADSLPDLPADHRRELARLVPALLGRPERGLALHQEAYRLAARLNMRYAQVEVAINLLWALSTLGRNVEAVAVAEEALALGEYDSTPTLRNNLAWSMRELGRIDEAMRLCEQLAAGRDPTLALIARARLIDMRMRGEARRDAGPQIDALLADLGSTDVYQAQLTAAKTVLTFGSASQVQRVLPWLHPQPIDPWLHRELSATLLARGIDPVRYLGASNAR